MAQFGYSVYQAANERISVPHEFLIWDCDFITASSRRDPCSTYWDMILVDPIPFLLHFPDTTYNFTRRKPRSASEIFLFYFASMDMGSAHTLCRRFFWNQLILWKEDLKGRRMRYHYRCCSGGCLSNPGRQHNRN